MTPLPRLMVAPNGARRGKADHPALPVTLDEIVDTARACHAAGADGLHLHLRDREGKHVLDAGLYSEALDALTNAVPGLAVQVTTEAVGIYDSAHQMDIALTSRAKLVSTSIRELMSGTDAATAERFFRQCRDAGIAVQYILYNTDDLDLLKSVIPEDLFRASGIHILFVLGRYAANQNSSPEDLQPFLNRMRAIDWHPDWAVCAFGKGETACLEKAFRDGGKLRVGFENSFWAEDGSIARDNTQRVSEIYRMMQSLPVN